MHEFVNGVIVVCGTAQSTIIPIETLTAIGRLSRVDMSRTRKLSWHRYSTVSIASLNKLDLKSTRYAELIQ